MGSRRSHKNDVLQEVHTQVTRRAAAYAKKNGRRLRTAALSQDDLSQEALLTLTLYCPRMFTEPSGALITVMARASFAGAVRKGTRANGHVVQAHLARNGKEIPEWLQEGRTVEQLAHYMDALSKAIGIESCPPRIRHVALALLNVETYVAWCRREYGKVLPLSPLRAKQFTKATHREAREALEWVRRTVLQQRR